MNDDNVSPDIYPSLSIDQNGDVFLQWQGIDLETDNYVDFSRVYEVSGNTGETVQAEEKSSEN